ncbi:MAG: hypothetical protein GEV09_16270 [Pseudonocardiaceae bacterium]|nr:hypothetical protein [Pseudonocardiaceae bacterium]
MRWLGISPSNIQVVAGTQTRVSKLERGEQRPTETDLRQWADATGASAEELNGLTELLAAARIEYATHRDAYRLRGGAAANQTSIATREAEATRIAEYQPAMVPGLVQTAPYARELLSLPCGPTASGATEAEIAAMVGERIKRQDVLYQPDTQVQVILGEAHCAPGSGPSRHSPGSSTGWSR